MCNSNDARGAQWRCRRWAASFVAVACMLAVAGAGCSHNKAASGADPRIHETGADQLTPQDKALIDKMRKNPQSVGSADTKTIMELPDSERTEMYREMVNGSRHMPRH